MRRNDSAACGRRKRARRAGEAGFTLLELLVALTLLGLILAVIFGELRFTARAWDATDAKLDRNGELLSVHAFLRQRFQQVYVPRPDRDAEEQDDGGVVFAGSGRAMSFLGTMPANVSVGGFYEISLSAETGQDGNDLFISWRPFDEDGTARVADGPDNSRTLLRGVREVRFSYFGRSGDAVEPQWWDIWPSRDAAPSLIRVRLSFDDDDLRTWPELVVAPATVASAPRRR